MGGHDHFLAENRISHVMATPTIVVHRPNVHSVASASQRGERTGAPDPADVPSRLLSELTWR